MAKSDWLALVAILFTGWVVLTIFGDIPYSALNSPEWKPVVAASGYLVFSAIIIFVAIFLATRFRWS